MLATASQTGKKKSTDEDDVDSALTCVLDDLLDVLRRVGHPRRVCTVLGEHRQLRVGRERERERLRVDCSERKRPDELLLRRPSKADVSLTDVPVEDRQLAHEHSVDEPLDVFEGEEVSAAVEPVSAPWKPRLVVDLHRQIRSELMAVVDRRGVPNLLERGKTAEETKRGRRGEDGGRRVGRYRQVVWRATDCKRSTIWLESCGQKGSTHKTRPSRPWV